MEQQQRDWAEILDKLERIQTLQERASTQGEAEAAAAALNRLLVRYNLTMVDLERRLGNRTPADGYIRVAVDVGAKANWRRTLLHFIAIHTYCTTIYIPHTARCAIVGEEHNIVVVCDLFDWLAPTCERLATSTWCRKYLAGELTTETSRAWQQSYKVGFVSGIYDALRAAKTAAEAEIPNSTALVVVKDEALAKAADRLLGAQKRGDQMTASDYDGRRAGYAAGRAQDMNRTAQLVAGAD